MCCFFLCRRRPILCHSMDIIIFESAGFVFQKKKNPKNKSIDSNRTPVVCRRSIHNLRRERRFRRQKEGERKRKRESASVRARAKGKRERERKKERKKERVGMKVYKSTHNNNTVNNVAAAPNVKGGKNATTSTTPTGTLRGYWKAEEETALRAAVQKHGIGAWEKMRTDPDFKALRYVFVVGDVALAAACAFNIALVVGRSLVQKNHHHQKISFFDFFLSFSSSQTHSLSLFHTHTKHNTQNTHTEEELECN